MFKPTKMGLLNFWSYDEEEYEFYDGKLLLRGRNGSGKSVTMQSFIPLILDGNKTPKRLDTFGGNDKHIEYYLLGDDKDASTGYLYMEFYDADTDKYITIGIGLSARRGKPTDFYGFALKDGSRINEDFELYKLKDGFSKTPLTKMELKSRLGINNVFVETAKDYKKMVNSLLYGFKNIEAYDDFINIILQIRSPKLSKDYKPSILMKTLNDVLPPLSDEDLKPLSDTIESLNSTKEQIEDLSNKIKELSNFIKVYNNYNETILYNKAKNYLDYKNNHEKLLKDLESEQKELVSLETELKQANDELEELRNKYNKAQSEKESINNSDINAMTKKVVDLEHDIKELQTKINESSTNLDNLKDKIQELKNKIEDLENKKYENEKNLKREISELEDLAESIYFEHLTNYLSLIMTGESFDIKTIMGMIKDKKSEIERLKNLLEEKDAYDHKIEEETIKEDSLKKKYESLLKELETLEEQVDKLKEDFINSLLNNNKNHQEFTLSEEVLKSIISEITEFNNENYQKAKEKWDSIWNEYFQNRLIEESELNAKLTIVKDELKEAKEELERLENTEEAELAENSLEGLGIKYLQEHNITYLPFYKAIDFKEGLTSELKNKIEANLLASGLLNAKIINEKDKQSLKNTNITYLTPSEKKKNNLGKYLIAASQDTFAKDYITSIIESISIDENDSVYLNENSFQFDFLKGNNTEYESVYIGYLNRKKEHERIIKEQEKKIREITTKISSLENLISNLKDKITILRAEKNDFPTNKELEELSSKINYLKLNIEHTNEEKNKISDIINNLNNKLKSLLEELNKCKKDNKIPLNIASFREASATINMIEKNMYEISSELNSLESLKELIASTQNYLEDTNNNYEDLFSNISLDKDKKKKKENELAGIEEILNTKEYQELASKLKIIEEIIASFTENSPKYERKIGSITKDIEERNKNIDNLKEKVLESELLVDVYYSILEEEFNLGYIMNDKTLTTENVQEITAKLGENIQGRDKTTATANYYKGFNTYRASLLDYMPTDTILFSDKEASMKYYTEKGLELETVKEIFNESTRQDIIVTYQNKKTNLYSLLASLKDDYETNKIYLSEKDRHLFEDILLRTVGGKIKDKINNAKSWVKTINDIIIEHQEKSNLSFYLSWLNKSRETLEEMDTKELVDIFKIDPEMLKKEDVDRLIKHFRSKISRAEETMADNGKSYFDIIFDILDYRNWFEFKLFYKKGTNDKKELTDKVFSVFSGGEKAKTMYIPLFASGVAKLSSASEYAPRLIALDEAFAGVDDANIEEMFGILKSFNLDYILTSQALWCDYREVNDISICELINDPISKTIGVKRYRWNGKVRIALDGE